MAARSTPQRSSSSRTARSRRSSSNAGLTRVRMVWISFFGAMTLAAGLLLLLDGRPIRTDGLSLSPLASAETIGGQNNPILTRAKLANWQAIVIHHSGSLVGSHTTIEKEHQGRNFRGLGHHFIIGNGTGMDDGQVHIGYRWLDQLPGAHAAGQNADWYNSNAISICLVGDGNRQPFTSAQVQQLTTLVESLRKQLGLPADRVLLASDIAPVADPGRLFPAGVYGTATTARK